MEFPDRSAMLRNEVQHQTNMTVGPPAAAAAAAAARMAKSLSKEQQQEQKQQKHHPFVMSKKGQLPELIKLQDDVPSIHKPPAPPKDQVSPTTRLSGDPSAAFLDHCDLSAVENFLSWGTRVGILLWLMSIGAAYLVTTDQSFEQLDGLELKVSAALFVVMLVTNGSRFLPLVLVPAELHNNKSSGILFGCFAVQGIALTSLALTILGPTPVLVSSSSVRNNNNNNIIRVHLVSWASRIALRFIIIFFTEGIDIPLLPQAASASATVGASSSSSSSSADNKDCCSDGDDDDDNDDEFKSNNHTAWMGTSTPRTAWWHGCAVALGTAAVPLSALAPDENASHMMLYGGFLLFGFTYIRLLVRLVQLLWTTKGSTVDSLEAYDRCRLSFRLMLLCSLTWTIFEVKNHLLPYSHHHSSESSSSSSSSSSMRNNNNNIDDDGGVLIMVMDHIYEGLCAVLYVMVILHINDAVFDEPMRAVRRLEALRTMMSAVWENSSDIVILCIPTPSSLSSRGHIKAIVSPAFLKLEENYPDILKSNNNNYYYTNSNNVDDNGDRYVVVLEVDTDEEEDDASIPVHRAFSVDLAKPVTREEAQRIRRSLQEQSRKRKQEELSLSKKNIAALAKLISRAVSPAAAAGKGGGQESLLSHDMLAKNADGQEHVVSCEANITQLESDAVLIVIRDISERFHRFEAEKELIQEVTERRMDAEANRFIRHEVKNGLLAAIALLESLQDEIEVRVVKNTALTAASAATTLSSAAAPLKAVAALQIQRPEHQELKRNCAELDVKLNEILETILDDAMSRDVVHDRYEPHMQRINVFELLTPSKKETTRNRFPTIFQPNPFPEIILDPRLLRFIHRNAVSNAVRYGKVGGIIATKVSLEDDVLQLQVINLPGDQHERLLKMNEEAAARVFLPSTQLHREMNRTTVSTSTAGDGAWIMQKCAKTLRGTCTIRFESHQTVFTMRCPAMAYIESSQRGGSDKFRVPETTYGIAIDDSCVQRKLMDRFLDMIGIHKSKRRLLGKDTEEILGLRGALVQMIRSNPDSTFLLIVDENLDIVDGIRHQTISGSYLISQIRQQLKPAEEGRILALVRSANDSAEDVALYKARAHGFVCKTPLKKESVVQVIAPLWKARFPSLKFNRTNSMGSDMGVSGNNTDELTFTPTADDLMKTVDSIDSLCLVMRTFNALDATGFRYRKIGCLAEMWPPLREEIHKLKGDLKTFSSSLHMETILKELDQLNSENTAEELDDRWRLIRLLILSVV